MAKYYKKREKKRFVNSKKYTVGGKPALVLAWNKDRPDVECIDGNYTTSWDVVARAYRGNGVLRKGDLVDNHTVSPPLPSSFYRFLEGSK